jgi:hypothetical protein
MSSRKKQYRNQPVFKTEVLGDLLQTVYGVNGKVKEVGFVETEKPFSSQTLKQGQFPEDGFIKRFSGV